MRIGWAAAAVAAFGLIVAARSAEPGQVAAPASAQAGPAYGHDLFVYYCASCHGRDGRGNGPAAPSLKISPPDLTLITARSGGTFPATLVSSLITNGARDWLPSHGSKDMPVWGPILRRSTADDGTTEVRVDSLVAYIKSIQRK